ncbi:hypothetical protein CYMTET_5410 [Cymbomonas tetramitiformis]|uniref:Uncharacterized protein n=1 Tax=Cymbomonas tetramitiformis TaxID=36881 RepID=A0AAE0GZ82_9CHLO|nr:hypothetical protein CYMTET_5410 [Cymbomonas tetramitiformis]
MSRHNPARLQKQNQPGEGKHVVAPQDVNLLLRHDTQKNFEISGRSLVLEQRHRESVGAVVWEAALVLARYLEYCSTSVYPHTYLEPISCKGKRILELGAGTGLAGMSASILGAKEVVLTDREEILSITALNVMQNSSHASETVLEKASEEAERRLVDSVTVKPLLWGQDDESSLGAPFDLVLAADLLYNNDSHLPLAQTMVNLCESGATVIMVQKWRYPEKESQFLLHAEMSGLDIEQLMWHVDVNGNGHWIWSGLLGEENGIQMYRLRLGNTDGRLF